jgi:plasmid stabilization system protein ParE
VKIVILDPAETDLIELFDFYEAQRAGLGDKFIAAFLKCLARIEQFPRQFAVIIRGHRICPMRRFKIGIYYRVGTRVYIEALIDLRRSKRHVKRRLG